MIKPFTRDLRQGSCTDLQRKKPAEVMVWAAVDAGSHCQSNGVG